MKKVLYFILCLALLISMIPAAYADEVSPPANDPVISEIVASSSLTFNGTTANCYGSVMDGNKYIVATMTLSTGGSVVGSWSGSGWSVVDLSGSCTVV